jgi:hypothetical protein
MNAEPDLHQQIMIDLLTKIADDVEQTIKRTLSIAPEPYLPYLVQAAASALGGVAAECRRTRLVGTDVTPDHLIIFAALIVARSSIAGEMHQGIRQAQADMGALLHMNCITEPKPKGDQP